MFHIVLLLLVNILLGSAKPSGGVDDNINNIAPKSTSLGAQGITQSVNRYANLIIKDN